MIDITVTATTATAAEGATVYAAQRGQMVRLHLAPEWEGAQVILQFSSGIQTCTLPLLGNTAEIPLPVLITPWRRLTLCVAAAGRALGPVYADLGRVRPSGATIEGGGSGAVAGFTRHTENLAKCLLLPLFVTPQLCAERA